MRNLSSISIPIEGEPSVDDLYLEDVNGEKAMAWVNRHNEQSLQRLTSDPHFPKIRSEYLPILNDPKKLIRVAFYQDWAYNFWQDKEHVRGIWRRTLIKNYLAGKKSWEILIDFDALAKIENKNWVFAGVDRYKNLALVKLSDGGKDANFVREFNLDKRKFVTNGFNLPEGKNDISWIDENSVFLGLALDDSQVTESGYPRQVRIWHRGELLDQSKVVFSGQKSDVLVSASVFRDVEDGPATFKIIYQAIDSFHGERFLLTDSGELQKLEVPRDSEIIFNDQNAYITLKSDWKRRNSIYNVGSLLKIPMPNLLAENGEPVVIFTPTKTTFLGSSLVTKGRLILNLLDNVSGKAVKITELNGKLIAKEIKLPENSSIEIQGYSEKYNFVSFSSEGFLSPSTIYKMDIDSATLENIDQAPAYFKSENYIVEQMFATSKDGTRVPYYIVHRTDIKFDSKNPTIINAYGGFELSRKPKYMPGMENAWLKNGGIWILANIRGGGEFGPEWHTSAIKENRQRVFDDFFAVAEDVIRKKITSPQHLGAVGGSNGGLLMGVAMTQRPDLFNAISIQVPLLDMLRYNKLFAGASWVGEYGDPDDPKMRAVIEKYSPYQNIFPDKKYPEVIFMTSTADDRVHPGHARRAAAKMEKLGYPFYYYENTEGGHGGSSNNDQYAKWDAIGYTYFLKKLK